MYIHNKKKFNFAMSAFVRMHGYGAINNIEYRQFCNEWSSWEVNAPLSCLEEVDQYIYYEYKNWRGR